MADIQFTAVVYKVQTLVDGGVRITLDLPETEIMQMAQLAECQRFGKVLSVICKTDGTNGQVNGKSLEARAKRKSERTPAKVQGIDGDTGEGRQPDL